ncbi:CueP family metal-binding protein [Bacillus solimangrovi]|uniref:Uncharacterized protein n=1 Tax=Bacillus solimangrovi TaxID=1305675 RepID=A0A1E5LI74_9BACI|nr:CueP family metal-binding protein [Bacillus solimangrovi]OEH93789.1 hypothetical protein BFG57_11445 [Bacillus solimangrovi]
MKIKSLLVALSATFLLAACSADDTQSEPQEEMDSQSIKELVHDYSVGNIKTGAASITSESLNVTDNNGEEIVYELPADEFFVSIAPYINKTHPCTNHNLIGCQGELSNENFDVVIKDNEGNVVIEETMNSGDNGFIDLWLPRDKEYQVQITQDGKVAESALSTFKTDGTCVTTMKLT